MQIKVPERFPFFVSAPINRTVPQSSKAGKEKTGFAERAFLRNLSCYTPTGASFRSM